MTSDTSFRALDVALIRVSSLEADFLDGRWPGGGISEGVAWLSRVWTLPGVAEAVAVSSPTLAARVEAVCSGHRPSPVQVRRMLLALARYLVRLRGRATPFGLHAGVASLRFGPTATLTWHSGRVRARADVEWLAGVVAHLEASPQLRRRLLVVANTLVREQGDRLLVEWQPCLSDPCWITAEQVSLRLSPVVRAALVGARAPVTVDELTRTLVEKFDGKPEAVETMLAELIRVGVLITNLRPPATSSDPLVHLTGQLHALHVLGDLPDTELLVELEEICRLLAGRPRTGHTDVATRAIAIERMRALPCAPMEVEQPLMVDLLQGCSVTLPEAVAAEAERAAETLVRLTPHPGGHPAWRDYHEAFLNQYGMHAVVPLRQLVGPAGLGFPVHYTGEQPPPESLSRRDGRLLTLAQQAALDGVDEVVLDPAELRQLSGRASGGVQAEVELCVEVRADTLEGLQAGDFLLVVQGVSRSATARSGRFLDLIPEIERRRMVTVYRRLPTSVVGAVRAQLSFPPRHRRLENVTRTMPVHSQVIPLAEHTTSGAEAEYFAVTADADRFYLVDLAKRRLVEPTLTHAASLRGIPPLARLLFELPRATTATVSPFSWGVAAGMPFLPRLRVGRTILSPARWRLPSHALPGPSAEPEQWTDQLTQVRKRLRLPDWVSVGSGDQQLRLNLDDPMDQALLRTHTLATDQDLALSEAAAPAGWIGRAHEVVIPLIRNQPPTVPAGALTALLKSDGRLPLVGPGVLPGGWVVSAKMYAEPGVHDLILTQHLPTLLERVGPYQARWWFLRYRDPAPHLRLRFHLTAPSRWGHVADAIGAWAGELRALGLMSEVVFDTYYPETARYGNGLAMEAAEKLFAADSIAAFTELRLRQAALVPTPAIIAASMVNLVTAVTGSRAWLLDRPHIGGDALDRAVRRQSIAMITGGLDDLPGGRAVGEAWQMRAIAATSYTAALRRTHLRAADVLPSLLHMHYVRGHGIDPGGERVCHRLARAVALAQARRNGKKR